MLSAPFWAGRIARHSVYAITDKRVITIQGGGTRTIRSYWPKDLKDVYRRERPDGSGDLVLGDGLIGVETVRGRSLHPSALVGVPEVRRAEELVRRLASAESS